MRYLNFLLTLGFLFLLARALDQTMDGKFPMLFLITVMVILLVGGMSK